MLFQVTLHGPGDHQVTVTDASLLAAADSAVATSRQLLQPQVLRAALGRAEPFLPVLAEVAGVGIIGQAAVQAVTALARRSLHSGHPQ